MIRIAYVLLAIALALGGTAAAEEYSVGTIQIGNPWTRATPKGATVAGAYMTITNKGSMPDRLVAGSAAGAGRFEGHRMEVEQSVAKMRPVEFGLEIKPGETDELNPGRFHVSPAGAKH